MNKVIFAIFLSLIVNTCMAVPADDYELNIIKLESKEGDSGAQLLYGLALLEGRYKLTPDYPEATKWLKQSAQGGNHYAQLVLANCYAEGKGVEKDPALAVQWWQKAADGENAKAQYHLGKAYLDGIGIKHDDKKAIDWLTRSAESGNTQAQFLIGKMYHEGYVVAQDHQFAKDWLDRAASNGHTEAINLLSIIDTIYNSANIVRHNSIDELTEDANKGNADAQYELGMHYKNGSYNDDQKPDAKQAIFWLSKAAENGDLLAMKELSEIYSKGLLGVEKDTEKARYWLTKSEGRH